MAIWVRFYFHERRVTRTMRCGVDLPGEHRLPGSRPAQDRGEAAEDDPGLASHG
jgi:hypothetical protein